MTVRGDVKGPERNQSPKAKRNPTRGANAPASPDLMDTLVGGSKLNSVYGDEEPEGGQGGRNFPPNMHAVYGVSSPIGPYEDNFEE